MLESLLIKFQTFRTIKRDSQISSFLWNLQKILRTPIVIEHLRWLLLETNKNEWELPHLVVIITPLWNVLHLVKVNPTNKFLNTAKYKNFNVSDRRNSPFAELFLNHCFLVIEKWRHSTVHLRLLNGRTNCEIFNKLKK